MPESLPPPATIRKALIASVVLAVCGLLLAAFPSTRAAGVALALIFAAFALLSLRNLRRSRSLQITLPAVGSDADMVTVLAALGVPLSMTVSDPQRALRFGMAKASLFRGHSLLERGETEKGLESLRALALSAGEGPDTAMRRIGAAAHYRAGLAYRAAGKPMEAAAEFRAALLLAPDYELARTAAAAPPFEREH